MDLQTIEGVELASTGTWPAASGEVTFSQEDLEDAVRASEDPTVTAPRLKLGHDDPRFAEAINSGELDGEPAFGVIGNMRLSEDKQTLIGDYEKVPGWLAEALSSSYPGRSVEGGHGFTASSGRDYRFVISDVALLGVTWPAIGCLDDLKAALGENGPVTPPVAAGADFEFAGGRSTSFVTARIERVNERAPSPDQVVAGLDVGSIPRQFCADLDEGEVNSETLEDVGPTLWWWPRSVRVEDDGTLCLIVDDDEGHLIRVPFTVSGTELSYGQPEVVMETFVPVAAAAGKQRSGPRVLASWPGTIRAGRPSTQQEATMDVDVTVLRKSLGLAEDADEAAITAALAAGPKPAEGEGGDRTRDLPDGMVVVDESTLAELRAGAQAGIEVKASLGQQDRDTTITAAIKAGKFAPGRREHYETSWEKDPEGTRNLLTASAADGGLAPGLVPVGPEVGRSGDGDGDPTADQAAHEAYMAKAFPQTIARLRGDHMGRTRVHTEA